MASIRHFPATHPLPDWRNVGVMLRALLGVNLLAALAALVQVVSLSLWPERFLELAAAVEPLALLVLLALILLRDLLWRLPLRLGQLAVILLVTLVTSGFCLLARQLFLLEPGGLGRAVLLAALVSVLLLVYFELRSGAVSPALAEARLAALNARIRPHFLFNTLNTVLSLIRARPQQAEEALESLADLFRAAMRDPASQVSLADELAISRQYLELEQLRLGERLRVDWQLGEVSMQQPIPPLILQPLLENAVYHGIEPLSAGGVISIGIEQRGKALLIRVANPLSAATSHAPGHQMALANIRERLALYYDLESRLEISSGDDFHEVRISLPCRCNPH